MGDRSCLKVCDLRLLRQRVFMCVCVSVCVFVCVCLRVFVCLCVFVLVFVFVFLKCVFFCVCVYVTHIHTLCLFLTAGCFVFYIQYGTCVHGEQPPNPARAWKYVFCLGVEFLEFSGEPFRKFYEQEAKTQVTSFQYIERHVSVHRSIYHPSSTFQP